MDNRTTGGPSARATPETIEERHWRDECARARDLVRRLDRSAVRLVTQRDEALAEAARLRAALAEACDIAADSAWTSADPAVRERQLARIAQLRGTPSPIGEGQADQRRT